MSARSATAVHRWLGACLAAVAVLLPFLATPFPPATDLPQHAAQIRLLGEALGGGSPYVVQWLNPNTLVYALVGLVWPVVGPLASGRVALALLALAWVATIHLTAARHGRPVAPAILAGVLIFNPLLNWGLLNFLAGMPVFLLWLLALDRLRERGRERDAAWMAGALMGLYLAHVLWLVAGLGWLAVRTVLDRPDRRALALRGIACLPALVFVARWYPRSVAQRAEAGFVMETMYGAAPWERLVTGWLPDAVLGNLHGWLEPAALVVLGIWLAAVLATRRGSLRAESDRRLLVPGLAMVAVAILAPERTANTILFAQRWLAPGLVLVLLGLPAPRLERQVIMGIALAVLVVFTGVTARTWHAFGHDELAGLAEAVRGVPGPSHVLGLDLVKGSPRVKNRPFLHSYVYAQALHGGTVEFSFSEHRTALVADRAARAKPWRATLAYEAETVTPDDLRHFDHVIVGATDGDHARLGGWSGLEPLTTDGRWRLYRVRLR